jgi:hypothetical protein
MKITLKDLTGTWHSESDENHYFDLTFIKNGLLIIYVQLYAETTYV